MAKDQHTPAGFIAVGQILGPHGLNGDLKVAPLLDHPDRFQPGRSIYLDGERLIIERCRWQKGQALMKLSGVNDRSAAEVCQRHQLAVPESDLKTLEEGRYYHFQLIGLGVRSTEGQALGKLTRIVSTGANDVFVVYGMLGEILIPAISDVIKEIDLEHGVMVIEAVPGLIPSRRRRLIQE